MKEDTKRELKREFSEAQTITNSKIGLIFYFGIAILCILVPTLMFIEKVGIIICFYVFIVNYLIIAIIQIILINKGIYFGFYKKRR